jgi:hypothetical protein
MGYTYEYVNELLTRIDALETAILAYSELCTLLAGEAIACEEDACACENKLMEFAALRDSTPVLNRKAIIEIAKLAGFTYHETFTYASFAPGGRSEKPEGFKYGLEDIPFETIQKLLNAASQHAPEEV